MITNISFLVWLTCNLTKYILQNRWAKAMCFVTNHTFSENALFSSQLSLNVFSFTGTQYYAYTFVANFEYDHFSLPRLCCHDPGFIVVHSFNTTVVCYHSLDGFSSLYQSNWHFWGWESWPLILLLAPTDFFLCLT